jgi:transketolase
MEMRHTIDPLKIRKLIIEQSKRANVGHIGSALSIVDLLAAVFGEMLRPGTDDPLRDRLILSKGHAALALYSVLLLAGIIDEEQLSGYCHRDGTLLGVHPEHFLAGVDVSTGSLGHGLAIGAGIALAARLREAHYRCFVILSDAECNEGSVWETIMFAAHHRLANLVAIVDDNGQQALGYTKDIIDLRPLGDKWRAFGWDAIEVDGHNVGQIQDVLRSLEYSDGPPHVLIAQTVCGKGVSFMEGKVEWHYLPMSDEQYVRAIRDLEASAK